MALDSSIGLYLKRINELILNRANSILKQYDLTVSQMMLVMYCIQQGNDFVMQKELESFFGLTHSTVIGLLKRLSQNGFVTVCVADEDKRQRKVFLTQKAFALTGEIEKNAVLFDNLIVQGLSDSEVKTIRGYLQIMYENLQNSDILLSAK